MFLTELRSKFKAEAVFVGYSSYSGFSAPGQSHILCAWCVFICFCLILKNKEQEEPKAVTYISYFCIYTEIHPNLIGIFKTYQFRASAWSSGRRLGIPPSVTLQSSRLVHFEPPRVC